MDIIQMLARELGKNADAISCLFTGLTVISAHTPFYDTLSQNLRHGNTVFPPPGEGCKRRGGLL